MSQDVHAVPSCVLGGEGGGTVDSSRSLNTSVLLTFWTEYLEIFVFSYLQTGLDISKNHGCFKWFKSQWFVSK